MKVSGQVLRLLAAFRRPSWLGLRKILILFRLNVGPLVVIVVVGCGVGLRHALHAFALALGLRATGLALRLLWSKAGVLLSARLVVMAALSACVALLLGAQVHAFAIRPRA